MPTVRFSLTKQKMIFPQYSPKGISQFLFLLKIMLFAYLATQFYTHTVLVNCNKQWCVFGSSRIPNFFLDPDSELFVPDPARMKDSSFWLITGKRCFSKIIFKYAFITWVGSESRTLKIRSRILKRSFRIHTGIVLRILWPCLSVCGTWSRTRRRRPCQRLAARQPRLRSCTWRRSATSLRPVAHRKTWKQASILIHKLKGSVAEPVLFGQSQCEGRLRLHCR